MNKNIKSQPKTCRLVVVKIVDSGPILSNLDDNDETIIHQSSQQKRSASPVLLANEILHKKVKLDDTIKKKPLQTITKKKSKLLSCKSSSLLDEKISKPLPNKDLNQTINIESKLDKQCTSKKLIKSQSTNDIKSSTIINNKKESISSPLKTKLITNSQTIVKKSINKIPLKTSIKPESTSNSTIKSPQLTSTIIPSNSNNTTPSMSINTLKKIPKKSLPIKIEGKRSHSLTSSSSSLNRKPTISKDIKKQQTLSSNIKQNHSSSSTNNNQQKIVKSNLNSNMTSTTIPTPPPTEDNHIKTPINIDRQNSVDQIQLSDESNSPHQQILIESINIPSSNRISYSDQSDTNDSNTSMENDYEEQDLPTSLTNDDLRYKLIYIYKRFQSNLINDLIIFVRFFKRNQLIDISTTKSTNDMFTYDLFSLSPSHIGELANDLGYTTINMRNSIEQIS